MTQDVDLDAVVRSRIRSLRLARGWSLDALAARCHLSPSTLSRIETGHRRIALDQLVPLARALGTTLDQLVDTASDADVVIRPVADDARPGMTAWMLTRDHGPRTVAKLRITRPTRPLPADQLGVHPGHDWFTVLTGTARLQLGDRTLLVEPGEAAEFSTMVPHAISAYDGPVELLVILDRDGERAHLHGAGGGASDDPAGDGAGDGAGPAGFTG